MKNNKPQFGCSQGFSACVSTREALSRKRMYLGRLGGSVGWAADLSSGHDLLVHEFEPRVGLCADSLEPGACFRFCVSLSLCISPTRTLSLSLKKKNKQYFLKKKEKIYLMIHCPINHLALSLLEYWNIAVLTA